MEQPARTGDAEHGAFGDIRTRLGAHGFVPRRIESLADRIDLDEALRGKNRAQLADRHAEAFGDGTPVGLLRRGLQAEVERIQGGQKVFKQAGRGELAEH